MPQKLLLYFCAIAFAYSSHSYAQIYNTTVEAEIVVNSSNGLLEIKGKANNLTNLNQSLRYSFKVIKKDDDGNQANDIKEGRFLLTPSERKELALLSINDNARSGVILLLLIYDEDDKLLGQNRVVLDEIEANNTDSKLGNVISQSDASVEDFAIRGIVTEDTKTKAGRDFYRIFYSQYTLAGINGKKVVSVKENFALGRSTKIEILVDNQLVFEFFAQTKEDFLKRASEVSLYYVNNYFIKLDKENKAITSY